jgi:hypothetical protein
VNNRQRVIDAYNATATNLLRDEVGYYMDTYSDAEGYDVADAINDALNLAEMNGEKTMARDCVNVLIAAGYYAPRTGEVAIMGRDRAPVRCGIRFDCVDPWAVWIEG